MSTPNAMQAAENLLTDYAEVLNTANNLSIASFYTFDGLFMPEGYKTIKAYDLKKSGKNYLKNQDFHISFDIQSVNEEDGFVFVQANATTNSNPTIGSGSVQRHSRDFFVLRREDTVWKIYLYLFNLDHQ